MNQKGMVSFAKWLIVFVGILSVAGTVWAIWVFSGNPNLLPFGSRVRIPPTRPIDEDRFLGNFNAWGVLSNFQIVAPKPGPESSNRWSFRVECDFPTRKGRTQPRWFVEAFADGELLQVVDFSIRLHQPEQPDGKRWLSAEQFISGPQSKMPDQFFTYLAHGGSMKTRVPISGILEWGGGITSASPTVFGRNFRKKRDMIRLTNPVLKLEGIHSSNQDALTVDFEVIDDSLFLDFKPERKVFRGPEYYLNVENEFGSILRYTAGTLFVKSKGEVTFRDVSYARLESEKHHLKRRPLRVYVTRETKRPHGSSKSSLLKPVDLFSNVLIIE